LCPRKQFYEIARRTKEITDKYNVPLIINDRLDICLAVGAAGLHIGQSDLSPKLARTLLPPGSILGLSVSTVEEARQAVQVNVADYVGIGAVWQTTSKDVSAKVMLGPTGVGEILDVLEDNHPAGTRNLRSVAIGKPSCCIYAETAYREWTDFPTRLTGGIHLSNVPHLYHGSVSPRHSRRLDGIAVISDIVSSTNPLKAASDLRDVMEKSRNGVPFAGFEVFSAQPERRTVEELLKGVVGLMQVVKQRKPLAHQVRPPDL
jgi:thiamine-phosphate diphosphorylase/hydroxyethylthiazole kinase